MILVTNDDGIVSNGIKALIEVALKFDDVLVVAPDSPQSGQGHAITIEQPLRLRKVDIFEGVEAYECSGTPVDCVKLAKNVLRKNQPFTMCLSGINHGSNSALNIIYSGTMSAAMEASLEGINSIGFSLCNYDQDADFSASKVIIEKIIRAALENKFGDCKLLNVNIPSVPLNQIKGIKVCRQGQGQWVEEFVEAVDPRGEKYYWLTGKFTNFEDPIDESNDIHALAHNYVSIVPSHHDLTHYASIESFKYLEKI